MNKIETWQLTFRQALPLWMKERYTAKRIKSWYDYWRGEIYISFSGGKDSTALLHQVRKLYPEVPAVFVDTGLEYPEIRNFVKTVENVVWLRPKKTFKQVIEEYGFPIISKEQSCAISRYQNTKSALQKYRRLNGWPNGKKGMISKKWQYLINAPFKISDACCDILKKRPLNKYARETKKYPLTGMMANESRGRKMRYIKVGCNSFYSNQPISWPMAFWLDKDVWEYLKTNNIPYSQIYNMGYKRTGCIFCMFGVQHEKEPNRFQKMKLTHPRLYDYCINKLGCGAVLNYIGIDISEKYCEIARQRLEAADAGVPVKGQGALFPK